MKPIIQFDVTTLTKDQANQASDLLRDKKSHMALYDMLTAYYVYLNNNLDVSSQNWTISISKKEKEILDTLLQSAQERK